MRLTATSDNATPRRTRGAALFILGDRSGRAENVVVASHAALHHSSAMPPPPSGLFVKTITIETLNPGRYRVVGSARSAAEALLRNSHLRFATPSPTAMPVVFALLRSKASPLPLRREKRFLRQPERRGFLFARDDDWRAI